VDPEDRRRVVLTLTARGTRAYTEIDGMRRQVDVEFLSVLSDVERKSFFEALDKLELQARRIFTGRDAWRGLVGGSKRSRRQTT
jgi:hypothetical protein